MFVAAASHGHHLGNFEAHLGMMAAALRGASFAAHAWIDQERDFGVSVAPTGILPEDVFDRQPFCDEKLVFACQARLDDRNALAARLSITARLLARMADGELLALAYRRWGDATPQHVHGDFAFIAWERAARRVVVACDHIGTVPLFYSHRQGRLLLATQLAALMSHPQAPKHLDVKALGLMVAPKLGQGWTMFDGICHLPGGSLLVYENGKTAVKRWWRPATAATTRYRDDREYVEDARALFDTAVTTRLRAAGQVATFLSGGLDSTLIASNAASQLARENRSITAFTSVPQPGFATVERNGWDADDGPWAAAVASMSPNMIHRLVPPGDTLPLQIMPSIHRQSRTVVRNTANQVWLWKSAERCRQTGVRVLLNGERGNSSISAAGAESFVHALRVGASGRDLRSILASNVCNPLRRSRRAVFRLRDHVLRRTAVRPGAEFLSADFCDSYRESMAPMAQMSSPRAEFVEFMLRPNRAAQVDGLAQFGIQYRDPMGDRRLMERLLTFPLHAFRVGGTARGLARELGKNVLPEHVRLRETRGSQCADEAAWFRAHEARYRDAFASIRRSKTAACILNIDRVALELERLFDGRAAQFAPAHVHRALDVGLFALAADNGAFS